MSLELHVIIQEDIIRYKSKDKDVSYIVTADHCRASVYIRFCGPYAASDGVAWRVLKEANDS